MHHAARASWSTTRRESASWSGRCTRSRRRCRARRSSSIYKNNSDGKGNSYGTHENYLVDRATPFGDIVRDLTPFFVSRIVFTGAGKVGAEAPWDERDRAVYQLTQRADFFETEVGLETTLKRPIINTRDEPHADPERYRRLHVIVGDANLCEVSTFLKIGTTAIVLKMIEDRFLPDLSIENPVQALHEISRDITCTHEVALADGRRVNAVQLQWEYLEHAKKYVEREDDTPEHREVLERWEQVLAALETDPLSLHRELDWVAKHRVLQAYRERDGLDWNDPKLRAIDLQYHDVRRDKGLYYRLEAGGKVERLTTDDEVETAIMNPPDRYAGVLPRPLHRQVPRRDRGRLVGLADRRHRRRRLAAHTDARAAPWHEGARRGRCSPRATTRPRWWPSCRADRAPRRRRRASGLRPNVPKPPVG